jgi:hypothetical protein
MAVPIINRPPLGPQPVAELAGLNPMGQRQSARQWVGGPDWAGGSAAAGIVDRISAEGCVGS